MNTKIEERNLQLMVFKCLTRVLKDKKMYHKFRCFIGYGNKKFNLTTTIYSSLNCMRCYSGIALNSGHDNAFLHTSTKEDIFKILTDMLGNENAIKIGEIDNGKIQMRITQFINTLLHCCVERTVRDFSILENIGQETFEMVCKKVFGENFVDETEKHMPKDVKRMMEAQKAFMSEHNSFEPTPLTKKFLEFLRERNLTEDYVATITSPFTASELIGRAPSLARTDYDPNDNWMYEWDVVTNE